MENTRTKILSALQRTSLAEECIAALHRKANDARLCQAECMRIKKTKQRNVNDKSIIIKLSLRSYHLRQVSEIRVAGTSEKESSDDGSQSSLQITCHFTRDRVTKPKY